eukprot:6893381-Heterocapsa_arctica.AAC.1
MQAVLRERGDGAPWLPKAADQGNGAAARVSLRTSGLALGMQRCQVGSETPGPWSLRLCAEPWET